MSTVVTRITDQLHKSELDNRQYRVIELENNLEALIIHDPDTDKASAAVNVGVGSLSDGSVLGSANAVEFPDENAYTKFLADHSGVPAASVSFTDTVFSFELAATEKGGVPEADDQAAAKSVQPDKSPLYEALDRLAQFLSKPLFRQSSLDREVEVIDSKHKKNLRTDEWRLWQLFKSLSNPEHPFSRFTSGNLKTLRDDPQEDGIDVRSKLMEFHRLHYSANRMKLVILGCESLDQLEKWAAELFSGIQNKNLAPNQWDDISLFSADSFCTQVFAEPVMDNRYLSITFPFLDEEKDEENLYEILPSRYIIYLINYEGPGSILAYLKAKGWATGISSSVRTVCSGSAYFSTSVYMTEDGLVHYQEIVKVIFHYIGIMKDRAPQEWIYNEMKTIADIEFRFRPRSSAGEFTSDLSCVMQKPIRREWLLSHDLPRKFDAEQITKALSYLGGDNFRLTIVSQHFPGNWNAEEKWYGTKYRKEKIPQQFLDEIVDALIPSSKIYNLRMPHKNDFIPHDLSVEKTDDTRPASSLEVIRCDEHSRVWYKKDDQFRVPKASVRIILRIPLGWTPADYVKANLFCDLVKDALVEDLSQAKLAGLTYDFFVHALGLAISVDGYDEMVSMLLEKVVSTMCNLTVDSGRFMVVKEHLAQFYRNAEYEPPFDQVTEILDYLIEEKKWMREQYAAEIEHIEAKDIKAFFPELFRHTYVELLAHGNLYKQDVLEMIDMIKEHLNSRPLSPTQWHIRRSIIISPGSNSIYTADLPDLSNTNNCILYYLSIGSIFDDTLRAKLLLLSQMTAQPVFDQLRTKEKLGFVVKSGYRFSVTTVGYYILIQSERAALYLESRIDSFLKSFEQTLEEISDEEFDTQKRSIINSLLMKFESLNDETNFLWHQIQRENFQFSWRETVAAILKNLTKADFIDFYHQYIHPMSETRAKLSVHLLSVHLNAHSATAEGTEPLHIQPTSSNGPVYIDNIFKFKARSLLGPGPITSLKLAGWFALEQQPNEEPPRPPSPASSHCYTRSTASPGDQPLPVDSHMSKTMSTGTSSSSDLDRLKEYLNDIDEELILSMQEDARKRRRFGQ